MQINNSPMFGWGHKKDTDNKAKHAHGAHGNHKTHNAKKHHQPAFGSITASNDSFHKR